MGTDKAMLSVEGEPLWKRQIRTLRALDPLELFISGPLDGPFAGSRIEVLPDPKPGLGPLAGIVASLRRMQTDWLAVLAVDMPAMTSQYLRALVNEAGASGQGIVPCTVPIPSGAPFGKEGLEPLAAVYPAAAVAIAEEHLRIGRLALVDFVRAAVNAGLIRILEAPARFFENWNQLGDVRNPF